MHNPSAPYHDRQEAGRALAAELAQYAGKRPVVAGLPRGGVTVAAEISRALGCDLDIIIAGKLRAPDNPEFAIGAVNEDGLLYLNETVIKGMHIDADYLEQEKKARLKAIQVRLSLYRAVKKKIPLRGRTVIIADDGLATGSTMISAIQAARAEGARSIIIAVPGGPQDTIARISRMEEVDKVVCPVVPPFFYAVSQLYVNFAQVEDDEVLAILKEFSG